jgi:DNA-binding CsgD family transcriptional regulator
VLPGRESEQQEIDRVLARARSGESATLALIGEAGIGKTALLDAAAARAGGMQVLRARGIESEAQIPFASLLEVLRPTLATLEQIPRPQAAALEAAFAMRPAVAQDRFAIGAATLSLLAAQAEKKPLAVLIDDAHWLDESSAQALLFAVRRLIADPIAVLVSARADEPSLLDGADLPTLRVGGLSREAAVRLLDGVPVATVHRLHLATAGNPLAMLELAGDNRDLQLFPESAPVLVPSRVTDAFVRRLRELDNDAQCSLLLAAAADSGDLPTLESAAAALGIALTGLATAETAGLVTLRPGVVEFRHPLVRSAVYSQAAPEQRRASHRALAAALPDRDVDRRAWHLAAAAVGTDEAAAAALEQAGARSRNRCAYAAAAAAYQRAAQLCSDGERRAGLLYEAAEAAWLAGFAERAIALLAQARSATGDPEGLVAIDQLDGHIATRRGPVMRGHAILIAAAERAVPERAVELLAEAANACLYAGDAAKMLSAAQRARGLLPAGASTRTRFLAAIALGMAGIFGGDAAPGANAIREAITLVEDSAELLDDPRMLSWLAIGPIFLREAGAGRSLLDRALTAARERAAVGALPFLLCLIARDQATTDRWAIAESTYREAIELARESDQRTDLVLGLAGLAWLEARRGREQACRAHAHEALELSTELGTRLAEIWTIAALGELELTLGEPGAAISQLERQHELLGQLSIADVDLSPAPELVEAYVLLGRLDEAAGVGGAFIAAAEAKAQPWSLARARRCDALLADEQRMPSCFEAALAFHARTPDAFEQARTRLAYGERLRRSRKRVSARVQLRDALATFERLDAPLWADRARRELAATGEHVRRRDPSTVDALTAQELQISLLLAGGKTTREAASTLFLSPKTVEYHLRHVYQKLSIHSRDELARALEVAVEAEAGQADR